ncbi:MAG TPA: PKD domain-containing protein, partial [Chitinophagales bacterium]|nr:PKD domain-containing protein [Chitinophagales bacterium]
MKNFIFLSLFLFIYAIGISQPANDACENAILISNVNNFCSANGAGATNTATDDVATTGGYAASSCWGSGAVNDVWYKFVAIATDVTIVINGNQGSPVGGTLIRPQVTLYSGSCGGTITELNCASPPAGQHIIQLYRGGLTIGATYLVRIDGFNANKGTFQYCINNFNPVPAPTSDCPSAVVLCDKSSFTVPSVTGAGLNNTEMNDAACFGGGTVESNSSWYVFTFATAGTFNFTLVPSNPGDDLDFVVYKLPNGVGNCSSKSVQRCMASAPLCTPGGANANTASTGLSPTALYNEEYSGCNSDFVYGACGIGANRCQSQFAKELTVAAGETYAIAINNFTSTGNGFNVTFGGSAQIQGPVSAINDNDADDLLCIGDAITFSDASSPPPTGSLVSWVWNFGVGATPATFNGKTPPAISYSSNGIKTISLTVTSDRGCFITSTKNITVASTPPTVSISASQNPICTGGNVTFMANTTSAGASPTYEWFLNGNPVGTNSNSYTNNSLNNNDQIRVRITSSAACNLGAQATSNIITMSIGSAPTVNVNSPSICSGQTASLLASGATSYSWSGGLSAISNPTTPALTTTTTYTVTGTKNGCTGTAVATVTVKPKPTVNVNSPSVCSGQTASLLASGATSYSWSGGLSSVSNPTTTALTTTTTYTVTGTTNACTSTAVATVTVKPNPTVNVNSPSICSGQTASLVASGATSYSWTGGLSSVNNPTTPALTTTTTYTVTGTTNACTSTAVATVTVKPNPTVNVNS